MCPVPMCCTYLGSVCCCTHRTINDRIEMYGAYIVFISKYHCRNEEFHSPPPPPTPSGAPTDHPYTLSLSLLGWSVMRQRVYRGWEGWRGGECLIHLPFTLFSILSFIILLCAPSKMWWCILSLTCG